MAVDLHIGTIETRVSTPGADPSRDPQFIARVAEAVAERLAAERRIETERAEQSAPRVKRRL